MGITAGSDTITCDCCGFTIDSSDPANWSIENTLGKKVLCTTYGSGKGCMEAIRAHLIAASGSLSYTVDRAAHLTANTLAGSIVAHP